MTALLVNDRGQAHLFAVLISGVAAAVIAGSLAAQHRLSIAAVRDRAGEAAAQAAGAVVADEHLAFVRAQRDAGGRRREPTGEELAEFLTDPGLHERALAAAREVAALNSGPPPQRVRIDDAGAEIEIRVLGRAWHRVSIRKVSCCRP